MATVFSTATLGLRVDSSQLNKEVVSAQKVTDKALANMSSSAEAFNVRWADLTAGIKDTKRIISGILVSQGFYALSNALVTAGAAALDFSSNMEQARVSLEYFVDATEGTEEAAAQVSAYLREVNTFAAKTPFSTSDVLTLSKYMQAVGVSMGQTQSVLSVITDAAAATGATAENLQRVTFALGQMITKGRIANEEIRQLANANIPIYQILQEELGLTGEQISNIGNYWIDANDAVVAILNGLNKRYAGASDRIAETFGGMIDTILDDSKIIADSAFGGIYDGLANVTANIRDTLDDWREIVTEQGSMGLFNSILLDIDPTGRFGNQVLAIIGNLKQLRAAFSELRASAAPLISVIGDTLYASASTGTIALTALLKVSTQLLDGLAALGITSGETGKAIASLYVAYKATQFVSMLGQALASAGMSAYGAANGLLSILPASISAKAGVVALTGSVATLITYLLTAAGIFGMLNNSFAGLDVGQSDSGFSSDYQAEYDKYQAAMDEYNKYIESQQDKFNQPYTDMSTGDGTATKEDDDDSSSSSSGSDSTRDWVAAFDEVYSIPEEDDGTGDYQDAVLDDFGALLDLARAFSFPAWATDGPDMPTFDFGKVFDGSIWENSDIATQDFWKAFLPMAITGGVIGLGKAFAKQQQDAGNKMLGSKLDGGNVKVTDIAARAFDDIADVVKDINIKEAEVAKRLAQLKETTEELRKAQHNARLSGSTESYNKYLGAWDKAQMQLKLISKDVTELNTLKAIAGQNLLELKELRETTAVLDAARINIVQRQLDNIAGVLSDNSVTTADMLSLQKEQNKLTKELKRLQGGTAVADLSTATMNDIAEAIGVQYSKVQSSFASAFTGALEKASDANRYYNVTAIKTANEEYALLETLVDNYNKRVALGQAQVDNYGTRMIGMLDQSRKDIVKNLTALSDNVEKVNKAVAQSSQYKATGVGGSIPQASLDFQKEMASAYDYLHDMAVTLDKLSPEALAEANAKNILGATGRLSDTIKDSIYGLQDSFEAGLEYQRKQQLAQALLSRAELKRINDNLVRSIAEGSKQATSSGVTPVDELRARQRQLRTDIRAINKDTAALLAEYTAVKNTDAARAKAVHGELELQTKTLHTFEDELEEVNKSLKAITNKSTTSLSMPVDMSKRMREAADSFDKLNAAVEASYRPLSGLTAASDEALASIVKNIPAGIKEFAAANNIAIESLLATGTQQLTLQAGADAFSKSIPTLVAKVLEGTGKVDGALTDMASMFAKQTAGLGNVLEASVRHAAATMLAGSVAVNGPGHVTAKDMPLRIQNDATARIVERLEKGRAVYSDALSLDIKTSSAAVTDAVRAAATKLSNGLDVIDASVLLAANKPSWYYQFAAQIAAFGTSQKRMMLSLFNRDYDFSDMGDVFTENWRRLMLASNSRGDLLNGIDGKIFSTAALDAFTNIKGGIYGTLDADTIAKLYMSEVITPLFKNSKGLFDFSILERAITNVVVEYSTDAFKALDLSGTTEAMFTLNKMLTAMSDNPALDEYLKAFVKVTRDGTDTFMALDFAPVLRHYKKFEGNITGWFDNLLGVGAGKTIKGSFTGADVVKTIDNIVSQYNDALRAGADSSSAFTAYSSKLTEISKASRQLAVGAKVADDTAALFGKMGKDTVKYHDALVQLAEATERLATLPSLTEELPRMLRTTLDEAARVNVLVENGLGVSYKALHSLNQHYKRTIELLRLESDKAAYETGQQIEALTNYLRNAPDGMAVLDDAQSFNIKLPFEMAGIKDHVKAFAVSVQNDISNGLLKISDSVSTEFNAMLRGVNTKGVVLETMQDAVAAWRKTLQDIIFVDVEASGLPLQTGAGIAQPKPVQISAINGSTGEQRSWFVNWGKQNKELLDTIKGISSDFEKAFADVTVATLDAANSIDKVFDEIHAWAGPSALYSGWNASNVGGYDLPLLNSFAKPGMEFLPAPDVMRMFSDRVNAFMRYGKNMKLTEAYEIAVGALSDVAHLADNDIKATYEVFKALQDGTLDSILGLAQDITSGSTIEKLYAAGKQFREAKLGDEIRAITDSTTDVADAANDALKSFEGLDATQQAIINKLRASKLPALSENLARLDRQLVAVDEAVANVLDPAKRAVLEQTAAGLHAQRTELQSLFDTIAGTAGAAVEKAALNAAGSTVTAAAHVASSLTLYQSIVETAMQDITSGKAVDVLGTKISLTSSELGGWNLQLGDSSELFSSYGAAAKQAEAFIRNAADGFKTAEDFAADIIDSSMGAAAQTAGEAATKVAEALNNGAPNIGSGAAAFSGAVDDFTSAFDDVIYFVDDVGTISTDMHSAFYKAINGLDEGSYVGQNAVTRFFTNLRDSVKNATGKFSENFGQYINLNAAEKIAKQASKPLNEAMQELADAATELSRVDQLATAAYKSTGTLATDIADALTEARGAYKQASENFAKSLILDTREGLKSLDDVDFAKFFSSFNKNTEYLAYYFDKASGQLKLIGNSLYISGDELIKGMRKVAASGDLTEDVAKELLSAFDAYDDALKAGRSVAEAADAFENLSKSTAKAFEEFKSGAVIYNTADDVLSAGQYAAKNVKAAADVLDESFSSTAKKFLLGNASAFGALDVVGIGIDALIQHFEDASNKDYASTFVENTLSEDVRKMIQEAGIDTGEAVAGAVYDGMAQALAKSSLITLVSNSLATLAMAAIAGVPGLIAGGLVAVGSAVGLDAAFGNDDVSKYYGKWSKALEGEAGFDTAAFEKLLKDSGQYSAADIKDLTEQARLTDTDTLYKQLVEAGNSSADSLKAVAEIVTKNYDTNAFKFITEAAYGTGTNGGKIDDTLYGTNQYKGQGKWDSSKPYEGLYNGNEALLPVRIAAAAGAIDATSYVSSRSGNGTTAYYSTLALGVQSAAADLEKVKQLLGDDSLRLGQKVSVDGKEYYTVLTDNTEALGQFSGQLQFYDDNLETLKAVISAVYTQGVTESDLATAVKGAIDASPVLQDAVKTGMGYSQNVLDAVEYLPQYIAAVNAANGTDYTAAQMQEDFGIAAALLQQMLDIQAAYEASKVAELGLVSDKTTANHSVLGGDTSSVIMDASLTGTPAAILEQLEKYGIKLSEGTINYDSAMTGEASSSYIQIETIAETLRENLRGLTIDATGESFNMNGATVDLGALSVTTAEADILAQAGIRINGDGTYDFMYAMNDGKSGAERDMSLDSGSFAQSVINKLSEYKMQVDFDAGTIDFGDFTGIKSNLSAALFALSDDVDNKLSDQMRSVLSGIGTITDDGILQITNKAILSGSSSMTSVLDALGPKWDDVSGDVKEQMYSIAALIDEGGGDIQSNIIEWASGVVVPAPISAEELTPEIEAAFAKVGIAFQEGTDGLMMVINETGSKLTNGVSFVDAAKWSELSDEVLTALDTLGVQTTLVGNQMMVDLTGVMDMGIGNIVGLFINQPDLWSQLPATVTEYLSQAVVASGDELLQIQTTIGSKLVEITDGWITSWDGLTTETQSALTAMGIATDTGMLDIKTYVKDAQIPETVDEEMLVPFEELPPEIQDELRNVCDNVEGMRVDLGAAGETGFSDLKSVIGTVTGEIGDDAEDMKTTIVNAVTEAMRQIQQLATLSKNLGSTGALWWAEDNYLGNAKTGSDGKTYYPEINSKGSVVKYWYFDDNGARKSATSVPGLADGGIASGYTLAGELGREMAILPDGSVQLVTSGVYDFPEGTQVVNNDDTEQILKYAGNITSVNKLANGNTDVTVAPTDEAVVTPEAEKITWLEPFIEAFKPVLNEELRGAEEITAVALKNNADVVATEVKASGTSVVSSLSTVITEQLNALKTGVAGSIADLGNSLRSTLSSYSSSMRTTYTSSSSETDYSALIKSVNDTISEAKDEYVKATTAEEKAAAHQKAEDARALLGYSGGADGSQYIKLEVNSTTGKTKVSGTSTISANAYGSVVEGDQLVRVGEFGKSEAILPLEQPSTMAKLGGAIAAVTPGSDITLQSLQGVLNTELRGAEEITAVAVKNSMGVIAEELGNGTKQYSTDLKTTMDTAVATMQTYFTEKFTALSTDISNVASSIGSALSSIRLSAEKASSSSGSSGTGDIVDLVKAANDAINEAKNDYKNATTDAEKAAAHAKAEAARATLGYSGGSDGSQYIKLDVNSDGDVKVTTSGTSIKANAYGSMIEGDQLVRVGEFGKKEAILPLEQPSVMAKLGSSITSYMSTDDVTLAGLQSIMNTELRGAEEITAVAIKTSFGTLTEDLGGQYTDVLGKMTTLSTETVTGVKEAVSTGYADITEAINGLSSNLGSVISGLKSSVSEALKGSSTGSSGSASADAIKAAANDAIAEAKNDYANATTAAEKAAAHAKAEAARATLGYSGGADGSQYIPLDKVKGSATGSLVSEDALYRLGEGDLKEAIVPLENPRVMKMVGSTVASYMPVETSQLSAALGMQSAGVTSPVNAYAGSQPDTQSMVNSVAQSVLESVLPAMMSMGGGDGSDSKTPIYVGTLIADDRGLKQLERKLYIIRQAEESRRK